MSNKGKTNDIRILVFRKLRLFAILMFALSGCSNEPAPLKLLQDVAFDHYEMGDTISVPIVVNSSQPLLLKIVSTETRIVVHIINSDQAVVEKIPTPNVRLAPILLVLEHGILSAGFRLDIDIVSRTKNSNFKVSVFELSDTNKADKDLTSAYSQYAAAISSGQGSGEENTLRITQLDNAAGLFRKANKPELALWSELIAAKFRLWPDHEFTSALERAEAVSKESAERGFQKIELMARNLEGVILSNLCGENPYPNLLAAKTEALKRYQMAVDLAKELAMPFETAWALNNMGISFYYLHKPTESIAKHQQALEVAEAIDDTWLENLILGNLGITREISGGAAVKFEEIVHRKKEILGLEQTGQEGPLAHALTELGRVYLQLHLFPEAVEVLSRALTLLESLNNELDSARVNNWLASAYHSLGNFDRAEIMLEMAIPVLEEGRSCRPLIVALSRAATLARMKGDFEVVDQNREKQYSYLATDMNLADYYHEIAMDALAKTPPDTPSALQNFEKAISYHNNVESPTSAALLQVQYCSVAMQQGERPLACSVDDLSNSYDLLQHQASPQTKFQGMQAWAQILKSEGRLEELERHYESMIELIGIYRNRLPGVLGTWYWEARSDIFNMYLELLIERDLENNDGIDSFLALDRIRNVDLNYSRSNATPAAQDRLRSLVLELGELKDPNDIESAKREIEVLLARSENSLRQLTRRDRAWLEKALTSLPQDTKIMTFHFSEKGVYRWVLDTEGVHIKSISNDGSLTKLANQVRGSLRIHGNPNLKSDLGNLGEYLLGDLADTLPENLMLISGGPLNGLPFDALMIEGEYIGSSVTVINMLSLAGLESISSLNDMTIGFGKVFAAGASNWQRLGMPDLEWVAEEMALVKSAFPSSELTIALDQEFNQDAFNGELMVGADLVHIASHSELNLEYPELSKFYLGDAKSPQDYLSPLAISNLKMNAKLVVLSACETSGSNVYSFDSNLGFVSAFLGNGAGSVLATLWPVPDRESFEFMREVYANLGDNKAVMDAYSRAKKSRLKIQKNSINGPAFAFQIYVQ